MKAIVVEKINKVGIWDVPEPEAGEYDAKARVVAASLCNSTDAKILHGEFAGPPPAILGHEAVGRIVEVGPKVRNYKIGDYVVRPRIGNVPELGLNAAFGSFVECGLVTDRWAQAEDEGKDRPWHDQTTAGPEWDTMALVQTITLKETLSFLRNFGVAAGNSLLVFGTGPVGVSFALWGRYIGCDPVIVVGRHDDSCRRAVDFGRATHTINNRKQKVPEAVRKLVPGGVTHAIEAIGDNAVLRDCIDSLAKDGHVGIYGVPPASQGRSPLMDDPRIAKAGPCEAMANDEVLAAVKAGKIPAREFVTHDLDYTECARGFELLAAREAFKVGLWFER